MKQYITEETKRLTEKYSSYSLSKEELMKIALKEYLKTQHGKRDEDKKGSNE